MPVSSADACAVPHEEIGSNDPAVESEYCFDEDYVLSIFALEYLRELDEPRAQFANVAVLVPDQCIILRDYCIHAGLTTELLVGLQNILPHVTHASQDTVIALEASKITLSDATTARVWTCTCRHRFLPQMNAVRQRAQCSTFASFAGTYSVR